MSFPRDRDGQGGPVAALKGDGGAAVGGVDEVAFHLTLLGSLADRLTGGKHIFYFIPEGTL